MNSTDTGSSCIKRQSYRRGIDSHDCAANRTILITEKSSEFPRHKGKGAGPPDALKAPSQAKPAGGEGTARRLQLVQYLLGANPHESRIFPAPVNRDSMSLPYPTTPFAH